MTKFAATLAFLTLTGCTQLPEDYCQTDYWQSFYQPGTEQTVAVAMHVFATDWYATSEGEQQAQRQLQALNGTLAKNDAGLELVSEVWHKHTEGSAENAPSDQSRFNIYHDQRPLEHTTTAGYAHEQGMVIISATQQHYTEVFARSLGLDDYECKKEPCAFTRPQIATMRCELAEKALLPFAYEAVFPADW